jgi:hypothetical protein
VARALTGIRVEDIVTRTRASRTAFIEAEELGEDREDRSGQPDVHGQPDGRSGGAGAVWIWTAIPRQEDAMAAVKARRAPTS